DTCATRIVKSDHGNADLHRQVQHFTDFFRVSFGEGTAEDSEVLGEHYDASAVKQTITGDDAVARIELFVEPKVARAMHDKLVKFFKAVLIEQKIDALTRRQLTRCVLLLNALGPAALFRQQRSLFQDLQLGFRLLW